MRGDLEALRTFALTHNELEFAHLCTAAIQGEGWAVERYNGVLRRIDALTRRPGGIQLAAKPSDASVLAIIHETDTTRPDGAIARKLEMP